MFLFGLYVVWEYKYIGICTTSGIIWENYKEIFNINDMYFVSFEIDKKIV